MASSGSRIPMGHCMKRPSDNVLPHTEKKRRLDLPVSQPKPNRLQRAISTTSLNNVGRFSEVPRRVLQPQRSAENLRSSLAATSSTIKRAPMGPPAVKKKIPAWDLKGRMEQMEKINLNLREELKAYNNRIMALEDDKSQLHVNVAIKAEESEKASATVQSLQKELLEKEELVKKNLEEISALKSEVTVLTNQVKVMKEDICSKSEEICSLKGLINTLTASRSAIDAELEATKALLLSEKEKVKKLSRDCEDKDAKNEQLNQYCKEMESRVLECETQRRRMHNIIQELKGNIRVFCRLRPLLPEELASGLSVSNMQIKDDKVLEVVNSAEGHKGKSLHEFSFDHVFGAQSTQDDVFCEISQLVQSVLDGYNVCIFAYGQTGSGKTYTMEGPSDCANFHYSADDPRLGMIPRSVKQIFTSAEKLAVKGWKYVMEASFMEIYNENIRDLLSDKKQNGSQKCEIKISSRGSDSVVSNVKTVEVVSETEVFNLLKTARHHRAVAATNCNERSSRSHYVFQMKLTGENSLTSEKCEGILNLVDLAGSERIKESGSTGDRLTEAKNINKSLSNLGNVIMSLSQKADHIPYRNSKLTLLLKNSLGGNSKTLMFVNINPCEAFLTESINSLRFATKVNQCNIGTAQKRVK